jgi:hypothetical protein
VCTSFNYQRSVDQRTPSGAVSLISQGALARRRPRAAWHLRDSLRYLRCGTSCLKMPSCGMASEMDYTHNSTQSAMRVRHGALQQIQAPAASEEVNHANVVWFPTSSHQWLSKAQESTFRSAQGNNVQERYKASYVSES